MGDSDALNSGLDALSLGILVAIGLVLIAVVVFGIWGGLLQWSIFFRYTANNRKHIGNGRTAKVVAEEMLAKLGYTDIQVCKASIFWLFFFSKWGNRYSPRRKKILLYGNILNKDTVTAVALATQKVGLVIQHKKGEKQMEFRAKWEIWTRMAPNMFLPIVTLGALVDLFLVYYVGLPETLFGFITLGFVVLAIVWTVIAFRALYLIIPTERRAGELALEVIKQQNLIPAQFIPNVESMYATYVKKYIADFILAILELILDILYVALKAASKGKR